MPKEGKGGGGGCGEGGGGETGGGLGGVGGGWGAGGVGWGGGGSDSATFVLQHVEALLVLGLECHDKMVWGDLPASVLVHCAHEDVVQA